MKYTSNTDCSVQNNLKFLTNVIIKKVIILVFKSRNIGTKVRVLECPSFFNKFWESEGVRECVDVCYVHVCMSEWAINLIEGSQLFEYGQVFHIVLLGERKKQLCVLAPVLHQDAVDVFELVGVEVQVEDSEQGAGLVELVFFFFWLVEGDRSFLQQIDEDIGITHRCVIREHLYVCMHACMYVLIVRMLRCICEMCLHKYIFAIHTLVWHIF